MRKLRQKRCLFFALLCLLGGGLLLSSPSGSQETPPQNFVYSIQLNGDSINPVTAEYITNAIDKAEADGAAALLFKLDTPGGLLNSTRTIVKRILSSDVPVIVYIAPSGSRAGSAGVFITYASHIAAMAPSTNIGAAHPVQMGGGSKKNKEDGLWDSFKELTKDSEEAKDGGKEEEDKESEKGEKAAGEGEAKEEIVADEDPMSSKILQDTVAFVKSLAKKRGRNIEWAVQSVTKSASITADEALELNVVELIATSDRQLLEKIDGRQVMVLDEEITLQTKDAEIREILMDARQKLFNILADPNVAYILMMLGFYGLLYEVTHPGFGVPGVVGLIFLILAFFSMQTLPTNYAGLALVILGLVLFIAEAYVPGLGLLTLGGLICVILGSLLLFESAAPFMQLSLALILAFSLTTALITVFLVRLVLRVHSSKTISGKEGMINETGRAVKTFSKGEGKVFVHGEIWNAVSDEGIKKDDKIIVTEVNGMTVTVKKKT